VSVVPSSLAARGIERGRRLVEEQQRRIHRERAGMATRCASPPESSRGGAGAVSDAEMIE
jgi:hypothetical protein